MASQDITLRGATIRADGNGFLCLTDMWKVAGELYTKRPAIWTKLPTTKELHAALKVKFFDHKEFIVARRGRRQGGTFAHVILALSYGEYLSPELGIEVREIALRVYAGDVSVLDDYKRGYAEQLEDDGSRVMAREELRRNNYDLNGILKSVGATHGTQYAEFHNHGYRGLYNEETENDIHRRKGLKRGERILDYMNFHEMAANIFRTSSAQQYLKHHPVEGVRRACEVHHRMGRSVRDFLSGHDLPMPEQQPRVDSIKVAEKRLKHATVRRLPRE